MRYATATVWRHVGNNDNNDSINDNIKVDFLDVLVMTTKSYLQLSIVFKRYGNRNLAVAR